MIPRFGLIAAFIAFASPAYADYQLTFNGFFDGQEYDFNPDGTGKIFGEPELEDIYGPGTITFTAIPGVSMGPTLYEIVQGDFISRSVSFSGTSVTITYNGVTYTEYPAGPTGGFISYIVTTGLNSITGRPYADSYIGGQTVDGSAVSLVAPTLGPPTSSDTLVQNGIILYDDMGNVAGSYEVDDVTSIEENFSQLIPGIPEPMSWTLLLGGLGLVASSVRWRRPGKNASADAGSCRQNHKPA